MNPTPCANPACPKHLTIKQLVRGFRFCCRRCSVSQPRKGKAETYAETAQRLGITRVTLHKARCEGRFENGVYVPAKIGRPEK